MKKLLSLVAAITLTVPSTTSVISCGQKIETDVLFVLPGETTGTANAAVARAYKEVANEFNNSNEMKDVKTKIKVQWEPKNAVEARFASNEQLPDLYVEYGDRVSQFAEIPATKYAVRDMASSMYPEDKDATEKTESTYWDPDFATTGDYRVHDEKDEKNDNKVRKVVNLQLTKSFDMAVVNLKVFLELAHYAGINFSNQLTDKNGTKNTSGQSHLFDDFDGEITADNWKEINGELGNYNLSAKHVSNYNLKDELMKIYNKQSNEFTNQVDQIRGFFRYDYNVLAMARLYAILYQNVWNKESTKLRWQRDGINDNQQVYALGMDDTPNKIYYEYSAALQKATIDPWSDEGFIYKINQVDGNNNKMSAVINGEEGENTGYSNANNFFASINENRTNEQKSETDYRHAWRGTQMLGKVDGSTYTYSFFKQGTMLLDEISSSAIDAFTKPSDNPDGPNNKAYDVKNDIITTGASAGYGIRHGENDTMDRFTSLSQGPGISGFKSVGSNAEEKELVISKFLKYIMSPLNQNKMAIKAGYMPSSKEGLKMYLNYKNGDYTNNPNDSNKWISGNGPTNGGPEADQYQPIDMTGNYKITNPVVVDLLKTFYTEDATFHNNTNILATTNAPIGQEFRYSIGAIMKNYVYKKDHTFAEMFEDGNKPWNLNRSIHLSLPGDFSYSDVTVKK